MCPSEPESRPRVLSVSIFCRSAQTQKGNNSLRRGVLLPSYCRRAYCPTSRS